MGIIEVNKNHHGQTIQVTLGKVLLVSLPENPTTGYCWHHDEISGLRLISSDFRNYNEDAAGSMGQRI